MQMCTAVGMPIAATITKRARPAISQRPPGEPSGGRLVWRTVRPSAQTVNRVAGSSPIGTIRITWTGSFNP